jgi:hypothetical protein
MCGLARAASRLELPLSGGLCNYPKENYLPFFLAKGELLLRGAALIFSTNRRIVGIKTRVTVFT